MRDMCCRDKVRLTAEKAGQLSPPTSIVGQLHSAGNADVEESGCIVSILKSDISGQKPVGVTSSIFSVPSRQTFSELPTGCAESSISLATNSSFAEAPAGAGVPNSLDSTPYPSRFREKILAANFRF